MWALACAGAPSGADEPIRVREGTFVEGSPPEDPLAETPAVVYAASPGFVIARGQAAISFSGGVTDDAWSVAVWFPDAGGRGYWVVPTGLPDPTQPGTSTFAFTVDFSPDVPYGLHPLALVAVDAQARGGPRYDVTLCVLPDQADGNFAACDPASPPQDTILSLRWDRPVDLDLVVVTPEGKIVTPKVPTTAIDEDGDGYADDVADPSTGVMTRDANGGCVLDGTNLESLVFAEEPPPGDYSVYVSFWSACGEDTVNFGLSLYERVDERDGTFSVAEEELGAGLLLAHRADRGATLGAHLTTVTFPRR